MKCFRIVFFILILVAMVACQVDFKDPLPVPAPDVTSIPKPSPTPGPVLYGMWDVEYLSGEYAGETGSVELNETVDGIYQGVAEMQPNKIQVIFITLNADNTVDGTAENNTIGVITFYGEYDESNTILCSYNATPAGTLAFYRR